MSLELSAEARVEAALQDAWRIASGHDKSGQYDNLDLNIELEDEVKTGLLVLAKAREISLQDVHDVNAAVEARHREKAFESAKRVGLCFAASTELCLYRVENKSGKSIEIIARSPDCARYFAYLQGHVQQEANATVYRYTDQHIAKLRTDGSARGRALREGVPGVLKTIGAAVVIERAGKVYLPMSLVVEQP